MNMYWVDFLHGIFMLKERGTGRLLGCVTECPYDKVYRCEVFIPHKKSIGNLTSYVDAKKSVENYFMWVNICTD